MHLANEFCISQTVAAARRLPPALRAGGLGDLAAAKRLPPALRAEVLGDLTAAKRLSRRCAPMTWVICATLPCAHRREAPVCLGDLRAT